MTDVRTTPLLATDSSVAGKPVGQLVDRTRELRDQIRVSGPFACTIAELFLRLGEPDAALATRARVERALASDHVRAMPTLTAPLMRAHSVIALTLDGRGTATRRSSGEDERGDDVPQDHVDSPRLPQPTEPKPVRTSDALASIDQSAQHANATRTSPAAQAAAGQPTETEHWAGRTPSPGQGAAAETGNGRTPSVSTKLCPHCAATSATSGLFCPECGRAFAASQGPKISRQAKLTTLGVVLLVLLGFTVLVVVHKQNQANQVTAQRNAAEADAMARPLVRATMTGLFSALATLALTIRLGATESAHILTPLSAPRSPLRRGLPD
jgi:hypothetical protein